TATLDTLRTTPESPGLHVEPIHNAKDDRIRSVRVNRQYRVLVFRLNSSGQNVWLVEGIYDHDKAYRKAGTLYLRRNPVSGTPEPSAPSGPALSVTAQQLIDELGLDRSLAERAVAADDIALQALIDETKGWQGTALLDLATGTSLEDVRASYFTGVSGGSAV